MSIITLRRVSESDRDDLIAANIDNQDYHRPWSSPFTDRAGFDAWFLSQDDATYSVVARHAEAGGIVGVINLSQITRGVLQSAYVGFYGMRAYTRRGLMTVALKQTIELAFGELALHRLEANIQPNNIASLALVQCVGFRKEGFSPRYLYLEGAWRDHERWAICADDA